VAKIAKVSDEMSWKRVDLVEGEQYLIHSKTKDMWHCLGYRLYNDGKVKQFDNGQFYVRFEDVDIVIPLSLATRAAELQAENESCGRRWRLFSMI
jgi:hypothetical protein